MKFVGFANQTDRGRIGIDHRRQYIIVFRRDPIAFGHAKGSHCSAGFGGLVKEGAVGRICTGPTALNMVDAQHV